MNPLPVPEPLLDAEGLQPFATAAADGPTHLPAIALCLLDTSVAAAIRGTPCEETVVAYRERLENGDSLPPIIVVTDGQHFWVPDGLHRIEACRRAGKTDFSAWLHQGTLRDAKSMALSANCDHGLPRSNESKRRAIGICLLDPLWSRLSSKQIAEKCRLSEHTVRKVRQEQGDESEQPSPPQVIGRDGRMYATRQTSGRSKKAPVKPSKQTPEPDAPPTRVLWSHDRHAEVFEDLRRLQMQRGELGDCLMSLEYRALRVAMQQVATEFERMCAIYPRRADRPRVASAARVTQQEAQAAAPGGHLPVEATTTREVLLETT